MHDLAHIYTQIYMIAIAHIGPLPCIAASQETWHVDSDAQFLILKSKGQFLDNPGKEFIDMAVTTQ